MVGYGDVKIAEYGINMKSQYEESNKNYHSLNSLQSGRGKFCKVRNVSCRAVKSLYVFLNDVLSLQRDTFPFLKSSKLSCLRFSTSTVYCCIVISAGGKLQIRIAVKTLVYI